MRQLLLFIKLRFISLEYMVVLPFMDVALSLLLQCGIN